MSTVRDIAVLVGSLRRESINGKVARALVAQAPAALALDIVEIGHLPLYNQDYDADSPPSYTAFRERIAAAQGVIIVTPEHNRAMPAALKNALDLASRPAGKSVWTGKPSAVISASVSLQGGFGANHNVRQTLVCLGMPCMPQPEVYLSQADQMFDEAGQANERAQRLLQNFIDQYARWVQRF